MHFNILRQRGRSIFAYFKIYFYMPNFASIGRVDLVYFIYTWSYLIIFSRINLPLPWWQYDRWWQWWQIMGWWWQYDRWWHDDSMTVMRWDEGRQMSLECWCWWMVTGVGVTLGWVRTLSCRLQGTTGLGRISICNIALWLLDIVTIVWQFSI